MLKGMTSATSLFPLTDDFRNSSSDTDEDFVLEDAGFFGSSTSQSYDAQKALNELGLQPSPPKQSRYFNDYEEDVPFDLDRELAAEEEQYSGPDLPDDELIEDDRLRHEEEDEEETLQCNGVLQGSGPLIQPLRSKSPAIQVSAKEQQIPSIPYASTSRLKAPPQVEQEENSNIGLNGLPKYIAAGTATATLLDGTQIRFEKKRRMKGWKPRPEHFGKGISSLLSQPVHHIIDRVEAMAALKVVNGNEKKHRTVPLNKSSDMWQERYRPQRFTELIGEERTHRDVLRWLKEWDTCVFGRKTKLTKVWKKESDHNEAIPYFDKWSRPKERILMLGGPAGMGKTTLAHVAAKQCGYLVHELNASDDRSAKTIEDRVRDALECKSLKQKTDLPTCLVLDEIDGATGGTGEDSGGFIKALIRLIERGSGKTKKGAKKQRPLLRPIICICNDPLAANLRALRPYSRLVRVGRPSIPLLVNRLRDICEAERIPADSKSLNTLVDSCQGDVRSCLNVLQLVRNDPGGLSAATSKSKNDFNEKIESTLNSKDSQSSIFKIWSSLFQTLTTREKAQKRGQNQSAGTEQEEVADLVSSIIGSGEMDKILNGCFEHYPLLRLADDGWWRLKKMHDWIYWYEYINKKSWEVGAQTEMWTYLPWSFIGWKNHFANTSNSIPEYPRIDYQNHLKRSAFDNVVAELTTCLSVITRCSFNTLSIITELGPSLVTLLSPDFKLINSQLVRPNERAKLTSLVDIMLHCNVNFVLDKNEQGQMYYRMEPPLEVFVQYEGKKSALVGPAKFQLRQMVVSELHAARVKARQIQSGQQEKGKSQCLVGQSLRDTYSKQNGTTEVTAQQTTRVAVDFFGRPIVVKPKRGIPATTVLPESILGRRKEKENDELELLKAKKLKVFYNYHEGFSNAVRKPVKMSNLLF